MSELSGCLQVVFGLLMLLAGLAVLLAAALVGGYCTRNVGDVFGTLFLLGLPGALSVLFGIALLRVAYRR